MRIAFLVLALIGALMAQPALAGDNEIVAIEAVMAPGPVDTTLFSADFLKALPAAQLEQVLAPIKAQIGPVVAVEPRGGQSYAIETAEYEMLSEIALDGTGKIAGFFVHTPIAKNASIDNYLKQMTALAPQTAYLITRNGTPLYSSNPDTALAVGSAFKLGVLKVLKDEIDGGARKWSDVVTLSADNMSMPSGFLQTWPVGSPLTLHTLAALMISISDNTAADTLLKTLGRDKVEAALGIAPAITTRELFIFKAHPDLRAKYQAADLAGKRAVLGDIDKLPIPGAGEVDVPYTKGVEWEIPPRKLCELIAAVGDLDVTQINPGVATTTDWARVSYKGGSEIGVLNFTTLLLGKDGATYCASVSWNGSAALDENAAGAAYAGVLAKLAKG